MQTNKNSRIAKNTLMLYMRMFLMMGISLFTSRILLQTLGIQDYGIYNIVGGIVVLFSFIQSAMVGATQRFLNFEIGRGNIGCVQKIFSLSIIAHFLLALFVVLLGETVGVWFVYEYINIPECRFDAALWVFHFCIANTFVNILRSPYNAAIIAYEQMSFYAYLSLVEAFLKLLIVYLLLIAPFDKLEFYAFLILVVTIIVSACYKLYCNQKFKTTKFKKIWDCHLFKQIMSFSGWSLFGSAASVGVSQGLSILQNIFFGVTVNAAVGVANQVNSAIWSFCSNFQMAFKPSIVKLYASGQFADLMVFINRSSKISFFLLLFLSLPICLYCPQILSLWLGTVPEYAVHFTQLLLIFFLLEGFSSPLWMLIQATGVIRKYQLWISSILFLNLPLSFIALTCGGSPEFVLIIQIIIGVLTLCVRIYFVSRLVPSFRIFNYIKMSCLPCIIVLLFSILLSSFVVATLSSSIIEIAISTIIIVIFSCLLILFIGLTKSERTFIFRHIIKRQKEKR